MKCSRKEKLKVLLKSPSGNFHVSGIIAGQDILRVFGYSTQPIGELIDKAYRGFAKKRTKSGWSWDE